MNRVMLYTETLRVLSIQSHVVFGYAGNKAAVFPMQKLGIEVSPIYTVQLSNHTEYPCYKGSFFSAEDIQEVINGLEENNFLIKHDAILSGYIGNPNLAEVIANTVKKMKSANDNTIYCCDPVFGDFYDYQEKGAIFATEAHPKMFLEHLLPLADIVTPNLFELSILTEQNITNYAQLKDACSILVKKNNNPDQIVVTTSTSFDKSKTGIAVFHKNDFFYMETPKYKVQSKVSGSGDITAAMFLSYMLKGLDIKTSIEKVITALDGIFKTTSKLNTEELALVQAQNYIK